MNLEEIIQSLKEALHLSPDNVPLKLQLASILLQAKSYEEAAAQFQEVLRLSPNHPKAQLGLAESSFYTKKLSTAIVILEQLIEEGHETKKVLSLYSKVLAAEGSLTKAADIYRQIQEMDPDYFDSQLDQQLKISQLADGSLMEEEDELPKNMEKPSIDFEDVGGMEQVKAEIELKIIKPLEHPELYKAYGKKIGGGILLYGPPGCGKTHLARATAGQVNAQFMNIGINDVLDMYHGNSERKLHEVFEKARKNSPCVLFFDEIDALGASRTDMRKTVGRHLINQFLAELDGVKYSNEGILILGATNAPWHLDPAFRRPGRFDRIIFVAPPDQESREKILKILLKDKPVESRDYRSVAKKTKKFSGADLQALIDICIEDKLQASFQTGVPSPITTKDLLKAAKKLKPSTEEWFASARNYALYANDSGLYDDILDYLNISK
jgi:transitional endoplasmic reticulum ATPase